VRLFTGILIQLFQLVHSQFFKMFTTWFFKGTLHQTLCISTGLRESLEDDLENIQSPFENMI